MSKKISDSGKVDSNASKMLVIRIVEKMLENLKILRKYVRKYLKNEQMNKKIPDSGKVDSNASKLLVPTMFEKILKILNKFVNFGEIRQKI